MRLDKIYSQIQMITSPFFVKDFYYQEWIGTDSSVKTKEKQMYVVLKKQMGFTIPVALDEVRQLIKHHFLNKKWNGCSINQFYLIHLQRMCRTFLTERNGKIALKYWGTQNDEDLLGRVNGIDKVAVWNVLNRFINTDLLVCYYFLMNGWHEETVLQSYHFHVSLADLELMKILDDGVSETHLHQVAAGHFIVNWQSYMRNPEMCQEIRDGDDEQLRQNHQELFQAATFRILLAYFVENRDKFSSFQQFYEQIFAPPNDEQDRFNRRSVEQNHCFWESMKLIFRGEDLSCKDLFDVVVQRLQLNLDEIEERYSDLYRAVRSYDLLSAIFVGRNNVKSYENLLLFHSVKYMSNHTDDELFACLFWQYIRIKNSRFQLEVQRNELKGLDYFLQTFVRGTKLDEMASVNLSWGLILDTLLANSYLKKIELRISNRWKEYESKSEVKKKLIDKVLFPFLKNYLLILEQGEIMPEIGLILHFIKEEEHNEDSCLSTGVIKIREKYHSEAQVWHEIRDEIIGLDRFLVGIDAANSEFAAEPAVLAPIFQQIRDSSRQTWEKRYDTQTLGLTYHVGEDYRHVLTGLRHIDEVIAYFQFRAGDRIGHAIALGVDIEKWSQRHRLVYMPRGEHLDNLLWLWGICKEAHLERVNVHRLEQLIYEEARHIYGAIHLLRVEALYKAYTMKFSMCTEAEIRSIACPCDKDENQIWSEQLLHRANFCSLFKERRQETIQLPVNNDFVGIMQDIQQVMRSKIARQGIVVETNPTSNAAIGEIDDVFDHYIFKLNRPDCVNSNIKVTINTDDPITFNTSLNNEYAYIYYSMLAKGYDREVALRWINEIRLNGMSSSFIVTRQDRNALKKEVEYVLAQLNETYLQ